MGENHNDRPNTAYSLGHRYEGEWGNCAQATLRAVLDTLGEDDPDALKAISGFHAGGGALCDGSCGAYSACVFAIARIYGRSIEILGKNPSDPRAKEHTRRMNALIEKIHHRFIDAYGSIRCKDIHRSLYGRSYYLRDPDEQQKFEAAGAHDWGCTSVVGRAAAWTIELLDAKSEV
jgi:hypothetical protein